MRKDYEQFDIVLVDLGDDIIEGEQGGIRPCIIIQNNCPILNKINPATIITDSFYSLAIYESYDRFIFDIISLLIFVIIFIMAGFLMTRRKKYASL